MTRRRGAAGGVASIVVAIVAVGAIAALAGYWYGTRQPVAPAVSAPVAQAPASPSADTSNAVAAAGQRKILYWHDPMVPGAKFDKPGKSPYMDMDLVPVYADDAADDNSVTISPRLVQNFGIRTVIAREGSLDSAVTAVGVVGVDERLITAVQARSPGYVERLHVRAQYDAVVAGQPLVDLYVPEWLGAEEEFLALRASKQPGAADLVDAARQRMHQLGIPASEIERLERDARPLARITVPAPESGVAWEIGARDGMSVTPGTTLFKLAGLGTVWLTVDVPEAEAAMVTVGLPAEVRAAAYPDRVFRGTVSTLLPEVNAATRTVRARIELANPGRILKPGMYVTVAFGGTASKALVVIPSEALIRTGKRNVVIVDAGNGRFTPTIVEVGRESGDVIEIRKGLSVGQRVVVSGQFLVDSEASLKSALARLAAAPDEAADTRPTREPGAASDTQGGRSAGGSLTPAPAQPGTQRK
ncbi:MAG TPA: efflux RND transporter periplasmic adaptor subunit [Casimicrobiaceae bacterium]|nr:efflux RND transporter periplasmic adaptor subunit [Casimicrobiaceae bacterium]